MTSWSASVEEEKEQLLEHVSVCVCVCVCVCVYTECLCLHMSTCVYMYVSLYVCIHCTFIMYNVMCMSVGVCKRER